LDITFNASVTSKIVSVLSVNTHIFCSIDYVTQTAMILFLSQPGEHDYQVLQTCGVPAN